MPREAIRFEGPLSDVRLVARPAARAAAEETVLASRAEREQLAAREAGYRQGRADADAAFAEQLMTQRQEVLALADHVLRRLTDQQAALAAQARACVPALVMAIVRRVLAGCEPDAARLRQVIDEALAEAPSGGARPLEVSLCPADLALLGKMGGEALHDGHPLVTLRADAALAPGDCLVRGNFGLIDGRLETKLQITGQLLAAS